MLYVMLLCFFSVVPGHTDSREGYKKSRATITNLLSDSIYSPTSLNPDNQENAKGNRVPQNLFRTKKSRQRGKQLRKNSNKTRLPQLKTSVYNKTESDRMKESRIIPKGQIQTKKRTMFRGSRRRLKKQHQSVNSHKRLIVEIDVNSRNYLQERSNKTAKQYINNTSASLLLLPDNKYRRRQNVTTNPKETVTAEQKYSMPLLHLFTNRLDKIQNETWKQEIRNHLTTLYAMTDTNHFRLLVHQMRHVKKIAKLNIKGEDLKPLVKDVIVKSGIMTKAYVGVSPDFDAMVNKITAEFSYRKGGT